MISFGVEASGSVDCLGGAGITTYCGVESLGFIRPGRTGRQPEGI